MPLSLPETQPWDPVSRYAGISWLLAYSLFLLHAFRDTSGFLFPDFVNLMTHEAGHLFFSWGGHTLMLLGGTLGELLVPLLCGLYFFFQGKTYGFAFSAFWFFENFLYIGTYMKDARACRGGLTPPSWVSSPCPLCSELCVLCVNSHSSACNRTYNSYSSSTTICSKIPPPLHTGGSHAQILGHPNQIPL